MSVGRAPSTTATEATTVTSWRHPNSAVPEVLLEGGDAEADGGRDGHRSGASRTSGSMARLPGPPPADDPGRHPEDQGDGPEPAGPPEPGPPGQTRGATAATAKP